MQNGIIAQLKVLNQTHIFIYQL